MFSFSSLCGKTASLVMFALPINLHSCVHTCSNWAVCTGWWGRREKGGVDHGKETVSPQGHCEIAGVCIWCHLLVLPPPPTWWNPLSWDLMDSAPPVGFVRTSYQAAGGGLKCFSANPRLLGESAACTLSCSELLRPWRPQNLSKATYRTRARLLPSGSFHNVA